MVIKPWRWGVPSKSIEPAFIKKQPERDAGVARRRDSARALRNHGAMSGFERDEGFLILCFINIFWVMKLGPSNRRQQSAADRGLRREDDNKMAEVKWRGVSGYSVVLG